MKEIWKKIPDCPSYYEASTLGRIRILNRTLPIAGSKTTSAHKRLLPGKILKPFRWRYFQIGISRDSNKRFNTSVHSLIARTFLGPRPAGMQVAHLNGNGFDNRIENLKYVTAKENNSHKRIHGTSLTGEKNPLAKLNDIKVRQIRKLMRDGNEQKYVANKYGVHRSVINKIMKGGLWAHLK